MNKIPSSYRSSLHASPLFGGNASYADEMYERYLENATSVPASWRQYFDSLQTAASDSAARDVPHTPVIQAFTARAHARTAPLHATENAATKESTHGRKHTAVQQLIAAHRTIGARWAQLDPLQREARQDIPELLPGFYGLTDTDTHTVFNTSNTFFGRDAMPLGELLSALRETYCGALGAEFMYITEQEQKRWWQQQLESTRSRAQLDAAQKKRILERLTAAEGLEQFLHTKYVGQKRFSLEGGESFIVAMDTLIAAASASGVREAVIGMAHRGRLNVLVNTLGKTPAMLFAEFEQTGARELPSGDVKYHNGFSSDVITAGGSSIHLALAFNPSHLEIVNPVVEGSVRARLDRYGSGTGSVLPILVHGDAAFAGQGVVMETLALAQTRGYHTGGTVHIVINNQIGFTTSDPRDARSTRYCTDIAKMLEAPVPHVNADAPEAVVFATRLALQYRQQFARDVVVDIVCYRKLGHNEQDTPMMTQPLMYKKIAQHPGTRTLYADALLAQGVIAADEAENMAAAYRAAMQAGQLAENPVVQDTRRTKSPRWDKYKGVAWRDTASTAISKNEWAQLAQRITQVPEGFLPHPLVQRVLDARAAMGRGEIPVDWGMGEHMAFASLVAAGTGVRLSGEDCGRGTFSHRHAVVHDQNRKKWDEGAYIPLANIARNQAPFSVIDSILSEEAVLGFEYGYASSDPNTLVIWEAQFGDFANGAQVLIDQFIAAGEVKWGRMSALTLMLPHGYEGQGPEHSSARIERFMQLAADANMQIVQPTSASQIFHVLRRQMLSPTRKPLIIFTPKSLLRHKDAASPLAEFISGGFKTVIGECDSLDTKSIKRIIVCSGKVYYGLRRQREELGVRDIAIVRVEQLYPSPHAAFVAELEKYPNATEIVWCQDEPENQGAWFYMQHFIAEHMQPRQKLNYVGRAPSAAPAVGYARLHEEQQRQLLHSAFEGMPGDFCTFI